MKRKNLTRNALFTSIISLLLCVSMLVGTTFAWFTDSVASANNIIKSGNLDIELEYWDGDSWENVAGKSDILTNTLWEPGVTEIAYLRVANAGSLALKYQLGINIVSETAGVNQAGDEFKLSDYINFGVVEGIDGETNAYATREAAVDALTDAKALNAGYTKAASMTAGQELYLALVVYMPTTVDNVANHNGSNVPQIDLGINVVATQVEAEFDSFGDDYDEDAWDPDMVVTSASELATAIENVKDGGIIALAEDLKFDEDSRTHNSDTYYDGLYYIGDKSFTIDLNGKTITNDSAVNDYLLNFKNDGTKANTITIKNGTIEASSSAFCAICTSSTNTQKITINLENVNVIGNKSNGAVAKIRGGAELNVKAGTVFTGKDNYVCIEAVGAGTVVNVYDGAKFYQMGTSSYVGSLIGASNNATVNVYGGYGKSAQGGFIVMTSGGTINVSGGEWIANNDGTYANSNASVLIAQSDKGAKSTVNVTGGTFKGGYNCYGNAVGDAQINISAGTFNADPSAYVADDYKAVETSNGYMVISEDNDYVADGVLKSTDSKNYFISSAAGYAWMDQQADNFFAGKTITLDASIDFGGATINAISFWNPESKTTFDGNGKTLSNFVITNDGDAGLFNGTYDVKNLIVDNANVTGKYAAVIAGNMYGNIDNVTVKNSVVNGTYWQTGALAGQYNAGNITNCVVDNCTINGKAAVGALVGIMNESTGVRKIENCTVTNNTIVQTGSFGDDYDNMFGVVVGLINIDNSIIYFNNCELANNTLKGVASELLYGVDEGNTIFVDGIEQVKVSNQTALDSAVSSGNVDVTLSAGEYKMPSSGTTGEVNISGTKETVLDMTMGAYMESANVTIEGVTIKTSTGKANGNGSDYAALYTPNVTYKNCTFVGPMRVGRDGAKFINCTFTALGNDYIWTYGNDVTFEGCTFNTDGKAILIYSDGGNEVAQVSVKNCVFNSTKGVKAGAIANQNCAAIEIHNYGNGVNLVTEGNTYDSNFSGEWRIKTYETDRTQIFVNGTEYTTIAIDGKIMTIDANKNVTVQ